MDEALKQKIKDAPKQPGCYLFKDADGYILYVGKSKRLDQRVRQYFQKSSQVEEKIAQLAKRIVDVEYQVTGSETDALILEYRLIKRYKPWFNAQLKRDQIHPYIRIDHRAEYPSLTIAQDVLDDGASYLGSFYDRYDALEALETFSGIWQAPICGRSFEKVSRACLHYEMHDCLAPCERKVDSACYGAMIEEIICLLEGRPVAAAERLEREMWEFAKEMEYQKAAVRKQQLEFLRRMAGRSGRRFNLPVSGDVLVLIGPYREAACSAFFVRDRVALCRMDGVEKEKKERALGKFLREIEKGKGKIQEGEMVARALTEVFAKKRFILLNRENVGKDVEGVVRGFGEW